MSDDKGEMYLKEMIEDILEVMDTIHKELQRIKTMVEKQNEYLFSIQQNEPGKKTDFSQTMFQ